MLLLRGGQHLGLGNVEHCWIPDGRGGGHWERPRAGAACPSPPPPNAPTTPPVVRDHRGGAGGGGGISVKPLTAAELAEQLNPQTGTPLTGAQIERLLKNTWTTYQERERLALKTWAATQNLAVCPPEATKAPACVGCAPTCYTYMPQMLSEVVPGGFEFLGVPFNLAEPGVTKSPKFERVYSPNSEQRILIEGHVIRRSRELVGDALFRTVSAKFGGSNADVYRRIAELSTTQVLELLPRWRTFVSGMALRAHAPTAQQAANKGGYQAWLKAGGFLISLDLAEGLERLFDEATCPYTCTGAVCRCGDNLACIGGRVPIAGADPKISGGCFWWYVGFNPNGQITLTAKHDDPSWLEKAAAQVANVLIELGKLVCGTAPAWQAQMTSIVAEKCIDKQGKPCIKGAKDCQCISPGAATQGSVGLFNHIAGTLCTGFLAENTQNPQTPLPPVPTPPAIVVESAWTRLVPWVLGGLLVGAGAFSATSR